MILTLPTTLDPVRVAGSSAGAKELSEIKVPPCMSKNKMTSPHLLRDHRVGACLVETPTSLVRHVLNQSLTRLPPTLCLGKWSHALDHAALDAYGFEYGTYLILRDEETQNCGGYSWTQRESVHLS